MNNLFEELYDTIYLVESAKDMKVRYLAQFQIDHPKATEEEVSEFTKEVEKYLKLFDPIRKQPPRQLMDDVDIYVLMKDVDKDGHVKYDDQGNISYSLKILPQNEIFRKNIDNYRNFDALKKMVDYIASKRDITQKKPAASAEKIIFEDDNLKIWSGQTQDECVAARLAMPIPYEWCIARPDILNMFNNYRYDPNYGPGNQSVFYFVQDKVKAAKEVKHWMSLPDDVRTNANIPFAQKIVDKMHQLVIQVSSYADPKSTSKSERQYILSNAHNDHESPASWNTIVRLVPKLEGHQALFRPVPLTQEQKNMYAKFSHRVDDYTFINFTYPDKKKYIEFYIGGYDASRVLTSNQFKECSEDLQNLYINRGVILSPDQLEEIKDNQMLVRRYGVLTNRQADLYIQAPDPNVRFGTTQLEILGTEKRIQIFKYYSHHQINTLFAQHDVKRKGSDLIFKYAKELFQAQKGLMNHYGVSTIINNATIISTPYESHYDLKKSEELIDVILSTYSIEQLTALLPDIPTESGYNQNSMMIYLSSLCELLSSHMTSDEDQPHSVTKTAVTISRILHNIQKKFEDSNQMLPAPFIINLLKRMKNFTQLTQQLQEMIDHLIKRADTDETISPANLIYLLPYLSSDEQRTKIGEKILSRAASDGLDYDTLTMLLKSVKLGPIRNAFSIKIAKSLGRHLNDDFITLLLNSCQGENSKDLMDMMISNKIPLTAGKLTVFNRYNQKLSLEDAKKYLNLFLPIFEKPLSSISLQTLLNIFPQEYAEAGPSLRSNRKEWTTYALPKIMEHVNASQVVANHGSIEQLFQFWEKDGGQILDQLTPLLKKAFNEAQRIRVDMITYPIYCAHQRSKTLAEQVAFTIIDLLDTRLTAEMIVGFNNANSVKVKKKLIEVKCANGPLDNEFIMAIFKNERYPKTLLRAVLKCRPDLQNQYPFNTVTPGDDKEIDESLNIFDGVYNMVFKPTGIRLD